MPSEADSANEQMVDRLIAEGTLWSRPLISAFRATPRHRFLDRVFQYQRKSDRWREIITRDPTPEDLELVYSDRALVTRISPTGPDGPAVPISSSSQPSLMAQMLEDLKLAPGLSVMEIGAGTGYNSALLAHVVGPGLVTSIDVDNEVLAEAWDHLRSFSDRKIRLLNADGRAGDPGRATYDRIMVTAATPDIEPAWMEQLADRGLLLAPVALAPGLSYVTRGTVTDGVFHGRLTRAAYFMPLRGRGEGGCAEIEAAAPGGDLRSMPAPWFGWFDRKRVRINWLGFSQSLAFFGLLQGYTIHYRTAEGNQPNYGISQDESLCWFGSENWAVNGDHGRDMGWKLWRTFVDAGGPWPTEFRLRAHPRLEHEPGRRPAYLRSGARCQQSWELMDPRDRSVWL